MSVEIYGPKGYDFQYLNSLLLALEYLDKDEVEIYIEKKNSEDAQIVFNEDDVKYIIDIQVKNRGADVDLQAFIDWICHFESRSSTMSLLNKLELNAYRFAIFISDARAKDDVSLFVDREIIHSELNIGFNNEYLDKIKECIKSCYSNSDSSLSKSRKDFLNEFVNSKTKDEFRKILKRIKLKERYTVDYSIGQISNLLNKKFYIPQSKLDNVIIELLDTLKESRGTNPSITIDLINIINKYSGRIILNRNENHVKRVEKEACKKVLRDKNVLLLTGVSFCGKSYLAKDIAQDYIEDGYRVDRTGELYGNEGAISFIRHRGLEDRILILEDPFGQIETKNEAVNLFNEVRNLIRESKANRKIIITSRKDILFNTISKRTIRECSIDSHQWIDLTLHRQAEIIELWESYYGDSLESENICNDLTKWLIENEKTLSLQLGHISNIYSSNRKLKDLKALDSKDIIRTARIDSNDLVRRIERRGTIATKVFIALGLSCNTYKNITLNDLAFILSNCDEKPGLCKFKEDYDESILDNNLEDDKYENYPKYSFDYNLNSEYNNELKYLRQHGYIEIDNLKRIMFIHPIYHFATQLLFKELFIDVLEQQEVKDLVKRIFNSISINAKLCTLTMLENLYKENQDEELKQLMLIGLDSIFPSVRDRVIMFFDRRINNLNESEQKRFVDVLKYGQSIKNTDVCWHNGMPYFNTSIKRGYSYSKWLQDKISTNEVNSLIKKIDGGVEISSEEMWHLLSIRNSKIIKCNILEKALSYDESFIRGKAIRLIFENYAFHFIKVDEYLNSYEHPEVIYSLFRGALSSWGRYSIVSKRQILNYFKLSLNIMSVAIRAKNFLENFEDEHSRESIYWSNVKEREKSELWNVWHEVFVEFLTKFPSRYIRIDEPHMVRVTEHSLEYVKDEEKVVELSTAWFNWLDRYLQYNLPDDYGMSVAQYLMDGTGNKHESREDVFKRMLLAEKTSFITTNIKVFIDYWNDLSNNEMGLLLELLSSDREDIKWIKAISLNREIIPREIQIKILGNCIDNVSISEVVDILIQKDLLEQCLNIHCGYPQPLWWNGYHHNNYKLWDAVIIEVLNRDRLDRAFDIALREVIDMLYNFEERRIPNIYEIYENDLLKVPNKRSLVFDKLLYVTLTQNQCNKKMWDLLLQYSSQEEIELYFDKIAEDIELVQYWQVNDGDLFRLFDRIVVFGEIYPRLEVDNLIKEIIEKTLNLYKIINEHKNIFGDSEYKDINSYIINISAEEMLIRDNDLEILKSGFIGSITNIYKENPPRLTLSNELVRLGIEEMDINSSELEELLEENRIRLIEITSDLRDKYDDHYDLANWID